MRRFVSGVKPYYNAKNSPINALRTGAILEDRYFLCLDDSWFSQYHVQSEDMDVFKASLDFARLEAGAVCEFQEVKTVEFDDYMNINAMNEAERLKAVKKEIQTLLQPSAGTTLLYRVAIRNDGLCCCVVI